MWREMVPPLASALLLRLPFFIVLLYYYYLCVYFVLDFFVVMMLYAINDNEADACYYKEKLPSITLLLRRLVDLIWCSLWQDSFTMDNGGGLDFSFIFFANLWQVA